MKSETGVRIALGVVLFCIGLFLYLGYLEVKAEMSGVEGFNNLCGDRPQKAGYCL
jgi:hypothetical protein